MAYKHSSLAVAIPVLLVMSVGCGSSNMMAPPPKTQSEFLYAQTVQVPSLDSQLLVFKLDPSTGVLSSSTTTTVPIGLGIAADPASKFLYLSDPNFVAPAIDIFSIDQNTGSLTANGALLLTNICAFCPPPSAPGALAMDSNGKFLYYGSASFGGVSEGIGALAVNGTTGALGLVPGSPFPADDVPVVVHVHPSGHFVYTENVTNSLSVSFALQSVSGFSVDSSTSALTPVPGSPFTPPANGGVTGFAIHPAGTFLYASTGTAANGILAWSIDSTTGALTPLPASPFAAGTTSGSVMIDPLGKFLYASNGLGGISGFTVDTVSGALTPMSGSPFDASVVFANSALDPLGRLLVAVDGMQDSITVFAINPTTGALSPLGSPTSVGALPLSLTIVKAP
jgi:6-phosphogluconolactonase